VCLEEDRETFEGDYRKFSRTQRGGELEQGMFFAGGYAWGFLCCLRARPHGAPSKRGEESLGYAGRSGTNSDRSGENGPLHLEGEKGPGSMSKL